MQTHSVVCAMLIMGAAACGASSQAEQVRDARTAKVDEEVTQKKRAIEDQQETREDAIERTHDLTLSKLEASGDDTTAAEEMADIAQNRASFEADARARLETIGVQLNAAEKKMQMLGSKPPAKLETQLSSLAKEHETLKSDVQKVPNLSATSWENTTDTLDERLSNLNDRVDDLTDSIEDTDPAPVE